MPKILSVSSHKPAYKVNQEDTAALTRKLFQHDFNEIDRLMNVFQNGEIKTRHFCVPLEWFEQPHDFEERNELYIKLATQLGQEAIIACLKNRTFLEDDISCEDIDAILFVSSSGISTPSVDARIMNKLPFKDTLKRIPIWGLGCAGGAAGLSRAYDYCLAHPSAKVLVLCVELCSLTFQHGDRSKSNLIGASLFADGVACALVAGDQSDIRTKKPVPDIISTASKWMPDSEDVMGWEVKNSGLHVVFSKDIPSIIGGWLGPFVQQFLSDQHINTESISHFVAHPGGKKVLRAYEKAMNYSTEKTSHSREVLIQNGNMSSPTVLYVLEEFMKTGECAPGEYGLMTALGPGFSGELLLLKWG
ncbi:type III polyketide synthase [Jeotgalibacillus proteolyticus]|uniref:Type III polyketide synthase n=1 Tax=Jeotgalibacillus proteolyticus TaxID=2082395 RepID=A0A2S5GA12_9BACL|nr:3-oxoacyl-[acyl-carrier-protein] synthase III C-terminal domain-containing protein [Jeotgalibacillus proteolyticus]PPA69819.1 type III polyketide synthase [Jeotgalibacillus proteolyticus]